MTSSRSASARNALGALSNGAREVVTGGDWCSQGQNLVPCAFGSAISDHVMCISERHQLRWARFLAGTASAGAVSQSWSKTGMKSTAAIRMVEIVAWRQPVMPDTAVLAPRIHARYAIAD